VLQNAKAQNCELNYLSQNGRDRELEPIYIFVRLKPLEPKWLEPKRLFKHWGEVFRNLV
jgi:hypothetical protein